MIKLIAIALTCIIMIQAQQNILQVNTGTYFQASPSSVYACSAVGTHQLLLQTSYFSSIGLKSTSFTSSQFIFYDNLNSILNSSGLVALSMSLVDLLRSP